MKLKILVLMLLLSCPLWAAPQADILIVVDTRSAAQKSLEHALREIFVASRAQKGISSQALPVDTYDVSIEGHQVAVNRLQIPRAALPYLAFTQLDAAGRPARVLVGVDRVRSAEDGLSRLNARYQELAAQTRDASPITGRWKQYAFQEGTGKEFYLLTMQVAKIGNGYHYTIEDVSPNSSVQQIRISNTNVHGEYWEFDSDWGERGIAHFKLHRTAPDRYEGWSYLDGEPAEKQMWIRSKS